ncbi:MAG: toprim domain-containing protein [Geminicoccaceae bacterium]|nr:toprim domain-containing protein [Geminicoccaceae bacterium]
MSSLEKGLSAPWAAFWRRCQPILPGSVAGAYLASRGCALPPPDGDLRWHPRARHPCGHIGPALIARVTHAETIAPLTLHRTWVRPDGTKAEVNPARLLLPGHTKKFGVVRLWPEEEVDGGLLVAEGIETALAAARGFGLAWATTDAGNLAGLPVLHGIGALTIAADHDPAGVAAARSCADRWAAAGRDVRIWLAPQEGVDFADFAVEVAR